MRSWSETELRSAVLSSTSFRQVLLTLKLRPAGGNYQQLKKYIREYEITIVHFTGKGWRKGKIGQRNPRLTLKQILVQGSTFQSYKLKKRLFSAGLKQPACEECGWAKQAKDGRIPLELDHINGDSSDNRLENLRVLCPNCHSLQPTHRGRNKKARWRNR